MVFLPKAGGLPPGKTGAFVELPESAKTPDAKAFGVPVICIGLAAAQVPGSLLRSRLRMIFRRGRTEAGDTLSSSTP